MKIILDAILAINPNAKAIVYGEDIDNCTIEWLENTTEINKSEIKTKLTELKNNEQTEISDRATNRTNAINKLKGATYSALTDAEVKALFGE